MLFQALQDSAAAGLDAFAEFFRISLACLR
jgi:hypothetical protein